MSRAGDRAPRTSGFWGYSLADIAVAAAALFLLIAYAPDLLRASPILLTTVAWPLGAAGLVGLVVLVVRRDAAARWVAGFLAWALVAALLGDHPRLALDAGWNGDRGWIYLAAYVGCWAIGRRRGSRGATLVTGALVAGLLANVFVSWLQVTVTNGQGFVRLLEGRASGLTQNPVYLGALMSGGVALCASLAGRARRSWAWVAAAAAVFAMAMAANLSGSRSGIAGAVLLGPLAAWAGGRPAGQTVGAGDAGGAGGGGAGGAGGGVGGAGGAGGARGVEGVSGVGRARWARWARWGRVGAVVVAIGLGLVAGSALLPDSGTARAVGTGEGGGGVANRTEMWNAGVRAWTEHPVFGWGPNGFRNATEPRTTLRFVQAEGPGSVYSQAHNLVVEVLVTTGIGGVVLLGGFTWLAVRRARGPLAWYAAGVMVTWTLEPVVIATAPTALLALGLAMVPRAASARPPLPDDPAALSAEPAPAEPPSAEPVAVRPAMVGEPALVEPVAVEEPPVEPVRSVRSPAPVEPDPTPGGRSGRVAVWSASVVLAAMALAGAVRLVVVDHLEYQVADTLELMDVDGGMTVDPATFVERVRLAEQARDLVPSDPSVADVVAQERRQLAGLVETPENERRYLEAARAARRLAPSYSDLWLKEAVAVLNAGGGSEASRARRARPLLLEVLERNPWSAPALRFLYLIDVDGGRSADAARWARKLCQLDACPRRP